ncbi:MAG: VOC family protein [Pseudomonadota bacterium]|jgi:PhnB protein
MTEKVQVVTPHLVVDNANAAIDFYKKGLGATETFRLPYEDGKRVMHCELNLDGARIFVVDAFPEFRGPEHGGDNYRTPKELKGTSVTIHIEVPDCDAAVKRMADAGATVSQEPWDAFWGARYGRVIDPFGHEWSFAHPKPEAMNMPKG